MNLSFLQCEEEQYRQLFPKDMLPLKLHYPSLTKQRVENQSAKHYLKWEAPAVLLGTMQRCAGNPTPV